MTINANGLKEDIDVNSESIDIETLRMTLKKKSLTRHHVDALVTLKFFNETTQNESQSYPNNELDQLKNQGASDDSVEGRSIIKKPPRDSKLSKNLIDLSNYYNASLFHYSAWWGGKTKMICVFFLTHYNQKEQHYHSISEELFNLTVGQMNWESSKR